METSEFQYQLDAERLSYLNNLLSDIYNFELKGGVVYTEQEQKNTAFE